MIIPVTTATMMASVRVNGVPKEYKKTLVIKATHFLLSLSNMCLSLFVLFTDMFVLLDLYVPLMQYLGWWRNCWCLKRWTLNSYA
ncbi:hypothetical protein EB796_006518 [Bugula neritina]|uniref:Uncharacterized protein n=1 Tax=Bugula neritina TaxID=10212 RepID=A0A7J7KBG8_BUGNE|nr:hypothetical protein EB796_006518 [Bugula neritina]